MARQADLYPLLDRYAGPLSARLGRPADEIREKGLFVGDFPHGYLDFRFMDGSTASLNWAFFVVSDDGDGVAVFTEHLGYHEFAAYELQLKRDGVEVFRSRRPEGWEPEDD